MGFEWWGSVSLGVSFVSPQKIPYVGGEDTEYNALRYGIFEG